ncbi:hypothetical protein PXH69_24555 [Rhodococcus qingshengii]|uniref:Uncharacterized protein n=1 Tax=Rhodococcus qingshengii TaxID=334542 RepID=A0AAW6LUQ1_RHOSG|nr:hypothetical protein [Rhodococcus qingshengii]MDE8648143.1 hypothetical protein [Rhodococcus qingshengii]
MSTFTLKVLGREILTAEAVEPEPELPQYEYHCYHCGEPLRATDAPLTGRELDKLAADHTCEV